VGGRGIGGGRGPGEYIFFFFVFFFCFFFSFCFFLFTCPSRSYLNGQRCPTRKAVLPLHGRRLRHGGPPSSITARTCRRKHSLRWPTNSTASAARNRRVRAGKRWRTGAPLTRSGAFTRRAGQLLAWATAAFATIDFQAGNQPVGGASCGALASGAGVRSWTSVIVVTPDDGVRGGGVQGGGCTPLPNRLERPSICHGGTTLIGSEVVTKLIIAREALQSGWGVTRRTTLSVSHLGPSWSDGSCPGNHGRDALFTDQ